MKKAWKEGKHTVVVDFSRGSINMAAAESAGEAVRFRGITQVPTPDHDGQGQDSTDDEVVRLIATEVKKHGWQGMPSACLLSRAVTSTQSFQFPPMPDADLRQAIALKLGDTLHFDLAEAVFDFRRVRERQVAGSTQVLTLVAVARIDAVKRAVRILARAGLKPMAVSAASESLANLTYYASPCDAEDATLHVDIGSQSTILNLFEGRLLRFSREIDTASDSFTEALMRPVITERGPIHLTRLQAVDVLTICGYPQDDRDEELPFRVRSSDVLPLVEPVAQRLSSEIRQSASYLAGILERPKIDYVVLSGIGAQMRGLDSQLEESLDVPVVSIDPVARAMAHWRLAICDEAPPSPAGLSAILGFSLGSHRPINLMPRERKALFRGTTLPRVRQVVVPSALAMGASLSLTAIPIQQRFNATFDRMQATLTRLDQRLSAEVDPLASLTLAQATVQRVRSERGPLPYWSGIMKELSATLPAEAHITALIESREGDSRTLELTALIEEGTTPFEVIITDLTVALSASPFFCAVRVVDASRPKAERSGELILSLEIAGHEDAWGLQQ